MVWRSPGEIEQSRRAVWRAVVAWGAFVLLALAALGVQVKVRADAQVTLSEPIQAGPLVARVPANWQVSFEPEPPVIGARTEADGVPQQLQIELARAAQPLASPLALLRLKYPNALPVEAQRRLRINGRAASLVTLGGTMAIDAFGGTRDFYLTVVAIQFDPQTFVCVELRRWGEVNGADAVVIQQVARSVKVAGA